MKKLLIIIKLIFILNNLLAQTHDTMFVVKVIEEDFSFNKFTPDTLQIDTVIRVLHNRNSIDSILIYQYLGSPGQAFRNRMDFVAGVDVQNVYNFNKNFDYFNSGISHYISRKKLTDLNYSLGSGKEQYLQVLHSQNILKGLNATIQYNRISGEGFVRRQESKISNFKFYPRYWSLKNKYSALALIEVENMEVQENGGIRSDTSLFQDVNDINLLNISLEAAENISKKFNARILQQINFGYSDSINYNHSIIHTFYITNIKHRYRDSYPQNTYYNSIYYDTTVTDDQLTLSEINNSFFYNHKSRLLKAQIGLENKILEIRQRSIDSIINDLSLRAALNYDLNRINFVLAGGVGVSQSNEGNFNININLHYNFVNLLNLNLNFLRSRNHPEIYYSIFQSNHFAWYNFLNPIERNEFEFLVDATTLNTSIIFNYKNIFNYTYFDEYIKPTQYDNDLNIFNIKFNNIFQLGKFGLFSELSWQQVNKQEVLDLPKFAVGNKLFFEDYLFRNALFANTGFELIYFTSYYGQAYMPALRQFYNQNEFTVGNFPKLNYFLNFKIKTARVFFKVENIMDSFREEFYYTVPYYPMPGTVFKIGFNWRFFD